MDTFGRLPTDVLKYIIQLYQKPIQIEWLHIKDNHPWRDDIDDIIVWDMYLNQPTLCKRINDRMYRYIFVDKEGQQVGFVWWALFSIEDYLQHSINPPPE